MMDPVAQIKRLGWEWYDDGMGLGLGPGVCLSVMVNDQTLRAFVPLSRVWLAFDQALSSVGCVGSPWVGEPWVGEQYSCGGFFSFVSKAVRSAGRAVSNVVPQAVKNAASTVVHAAKTAGSGVVSAINRIPVVGTVAHAAESLALLPAQAASQLVQGRRIDRIALSQFKGALRGVRAVAPYVQTIISFVPGIGQGISAGLGAALALAQGESITEALLQAARDALPGGAAAQAAFDVAIDAMQGKPITAAALDAIPGVSPQAKQALLSGFAAARGLVAGQNVSQTLIDGAIHQLPAQYQRAVQVGVALGQAKHLQDVGALAVQSASQLSNAAARGTQAAQAFGQGVRTAEVLNAMNHARAAQNALTSIVQAASAGHPQAQKIANVLQGLHPLAPPQLPR